MHVFTLSYLIRYVTHFNPKWICRSRISMNFTKYISTALLKNPSGWLFLKWKSLTGTCSTLLFKIPDLKIFERFLVKRP